MKKHYMKPAVDALTLSNTTVICGSVTSLFGTAGFDNEITDETTDDALSRFQSMVDDDEWDI